LFDLLQWDFRLDVADAFDAAEVFHLDAPRIPTGARLFREHDMRGVFGCDMLGNTEAEGR
jgi:hypothetical protein